MSIDKFNKAKRLLICIGDINDSFLEEAELGIIPNLTKRKYLVQFGGVAAAASIGIAVTYWFVRYKRTAKSV